MYVCPGCGSELESSADAELICRSCSSRYPVRNGIPRFVPAENYARSFGFQWNQHRSTQLDSHTGLTLTKDRIVAATHWPDCLDDQTILEAGSGAGRFTEIIAATGADLYTFDLSDAVDANRSNNSRFENVRFSQADMFALPFRPASFDEVICLGVIQHTPDPHHAFRALAAQVRPRGHLTIDCYPKTVRAMVSWKYLLRPLTKRMPKDRLYRLIERWGPPLIPASIFLRRLFGSAGPRLLPILQYDHWGVRGELNRQWCILDTFDMYSPLYDHPQTLKTVRRWYEDAGFDEIDVRYGLNGIVARGRKA
jgi:SAM-dependent methyltransferase